MAEDQIPQDEDSILVEVVPDDGPAPAEAEGAVPRVVTPEEGMAELRGRLEAEKDAAAARARDAEARAEQAGREVQASRSNVIDSRIGQVDSALETMKTKAAEARKELAAALAAGEYDRAAEIQETMAENVVVTRQLQANKAQLEHAKKTPAPAPQQRQAAPSDALEAFLAKMPAKPQAWLRARPEYVTDPEKNKRLVAAHHNALLDHAEGSDGYFAAVEKQLGLAAGTKTPEPRAARPATVSAPPSRPTPSLSRAPVAQQTVRLTAAEVRMAEAQGMTAKEWAIQKQKFAAEKAAGVTEH